MPLPRPNKDYIQKPKSPSRLLEDVTLLKGKKMKIEECCKLINNRTVFYSKYSELESSNDSYNKLSPVEHLNEASPFFQE